MGSATNNTVRNINPAKQKQHCIFRKAKHLFFIFRTIKLKHPSRTNNSHSYWVKSRLISGTFKDLHISLTESAELGNLVYLNHIQMKIKVNSYKMTVKYSHIRRDYISKPDTDEKTRKVIQVWIEKNTCMQRHIRFFECIYNQFHIQFLTWFIYYVLPFFFP